MRGLDFSPGGQAPPQQGRKSTLRSLPSQGHRRGPHLGPCAGVTDTAISDNAREYLLSKVRKLVRSNIEILGQSAGIRPATRDRRPFIGIHPVYKTIAIFNGFGSKGVSLIPYLSGIFTDHLLSGHNLEPDINIIRYFN